MRAWMGWLLLTCVMTPAWAGLFSSCDASKEPMPEWVQRTDYRLPGYYVGVGSAEAKNRNAEEQMSVSADHAKSNLVQGIEVSIRAENEQSTQVSGKQVVASTQAKVVASAEEVLRDLQIKARWMDGENCQLHTLMVVSEKSVALAKREKTMKNRLEKFKQLLADGSDKEKNRDIKVRGKFLDDARALLIETDFAVLPEELGKDHYTRQLNVAVTAFNKEASQVRGRVALFALNPDASLSAEVLALMIDQLRVVHQGSDRLLANCASANECMDSAREKGFSMLALLNASTQVSTSAMGSLKGVLSVTRTVYDIDSHKIVKTDNAKAEVIGWSDAELDWNLAAEKVVGGFK